MAATLISTLIDKARRLVADKDQEIGFEDDELLDWINSANRFLRRLAVNYKPTLVAAPPVIGTIAQGQAFLKLDSTILGILDARIGKDRITEIAMTSIEDLTQTGRPNGFYRIGFDTLYWYPIPDAAYNFSLIVVNEAPLLIADSSSPWPTDFDDLLVEYTVIRAQLRNEFDMSQEFQIMSTVHDQIRQMLTGIEPKTTLVQGYFDPIPSIAVRSY